ncbi:hypothetical protein BEH94_08390 [Candidatus Altiarchaeales archaeon WOR_SM1_SCG]|nr:hypothetical protein BEH94_08390 [Candidatus Altiarchaeales archaeon WOR_SM1_SCG]
MEIGIILLTLGFILISVKILGEGFERLSIPSIFGEIAIGMIIGSLLPLYGIIVISAGSDLEIIFKILAELGVIFLLFSIGFEKIELEKLTIKIRKALPVTILGAAFPFAAGFLIAQEFFNDINVSLLIGTALASTSIGVSARTLMDLKYLTTTVGAVVLLAAVIDNFLSLGVLAIVSGIITTGVVSYESLMFTIGQLVIFCIIVFMTGKFLFPRIAVFADKMIVDEAIFAIIIGTLFLFAYLTEIFGMSIIIGAFLFGASISVIPRFKTDVVMHKVRGISHGFFVPFFFVGIGLQFDFNALQAVGSFAVILLAGLIISQIIGGFLGGKFSGFGARDSIIIGMSLIPRNELALIVTAIGLALNVLKPEIFSAIVFMAVATTLAAPLLLRMAIRSN